MPSSRLYPAKRGRSAVTVDLEQLSRDLLKDLREESGKKKVPPHRSKYNGLLHLVAPVDLHVGKLAWSPETGEDYDLKIAESRLNKAVDILIDRANGFPVTHHILLVGNDLVQVDNLISQTTAGTIQDTDSRYRKMFRSSVRMMAWTADRLAAVAPVEILVVPGNHDSLATFHIGEVLAARVAGNPNITVRDDLKPRVYHRYGTNLLGFTHGNDERHADLPLVMAQECRRWWGLTRHREYLVGHLHKKRERQFNAGDSFNGVRVRVLPSLTGTDYWHAKKGYIGEPKASESSVYDPTDGLIATFTATIR